MIFDKLIFPSPNSPFYLFISQYLPVNDDLQIGSEYFNKSREIPTIHSFQQVYDENKGDASSAHHEEQKNPFDRTNDIVNCVKSLQQKLDACKILLYGEIRHVKQSQDESQDNYANIELFGGTQRSGKKNELVEGDYKAADNVLLYRAWSSTDHAELRVVRIAMDESDWWTCIEPLLRQYHAVQQV